MKNYISLTHRFSPLEKGEIERGKIQCQFNDRSYIEFRQYLRKNMTRSEVVLWTRLRNSQLGVKFRRQHGINAFILDFYATSIKLNIEVDGITHSDTQEKDRNRDRFLNSIGISVLRINALDCFYHIYQVLDLISSKIQELQAIHDSRDDLPRSPLLIRRGEFS